jgi:hypothetical protein
MDLAALEAGRSYWITYECRDIGYGVESGDGEFVYRGASDGWGKHAFTPAGGGPTIYLFADEVTVSGPVSRTAEDA